MRGIKIASITMAFALLNWQSLYFLEKLSVNVLVLMLTFAAFILAVFVTYLFTLCRFHFQLRKNQRGQRQNPASLPYLLPWIGNGFQFACYPHALFHFASSTSVGNSIVRARLGPSHMYIITGAEYVKAAFGSSKNLTFDSRTIQIMEQVYGLPAGDAAPYKHSPGKAKELVSKLDQLYIANLANRECTAAMIRQFVKSLNAQVGCLRNDKGTEVMIGTCLRRLMATASISALFGDAIIEKNATFVQDYWIFSKDFKRLLYGMPKLFCRKGVHARDRMLKAIKAFILDALQDDVREMEPKSPTVESSPPYVSLVVRETNKFFTEAGFSVEGRASEALSLVFAINDNAIPTTIWMLLEILKSPGLHKQIYEEVQTSVVPDQNGNGRNCLDLSKLLTLPLLNSLYSECLRYHLSAQLARHLKNDIEIDGYLLKKGNLVVAPTLTAHREPEVWFRPNHLPSEVWPERFLHVRNIKPSNYFPYGMGAISCPGRVYAKTVILTSVATMLLTFDFEVLGFVDDKGKACHRAPKPVAQGMGVSLPDREPLVKLKPRFSQGIM
ncbi:cytochrome p450, conidia-enriched transcript [Histoplasma ohiense]|nr:cytochrome p450, conidia-enriched transcript [Histoplasma ohiense (nom. inval.)]